MTAPSPQSYTAANAMPAKLFQPGLVAEIRAGRIPPYHVQLLPTDRCNLRCSFCSCADRDGDELPLQTIRELAKQLPALGCRAATVSGGGEPLCHRDINDILACLTARGIEVGLVTNGTLLDRLEIPVRWCRVSQADERPLTDFLREKIIAAVNQFPDTDWAISYVIQSSFDAANVRRCVELANELEFTHVRLVSDMLNLENLPPMKEVKAALEGIDSRVIYQSRKEFTRGRELCYLSLLKPVLAADGWVYPCCGAQYSHEPPDKSLPVNMRMCRVEDVGTIRIPFDGSRCDRCYYDQYNQALEMLTTNTEHAAFV